MAKILVVDDDKNLRRIIEFTLAEDGHSPKTAADAEEALLSLKEESFDIVVTDIRMPGKDGITLLREIKELAPSIEVIVVTAFGTVETAVEAMKAGAFDYVTKPFNRDELKLTVQRALHLRDLESENVRLRIEVEKKFGFANIIGESEPMQKVFRLIEKVASTDAPVLITGESGTGKELVAKALHYHSLRAKGPLVTINCAAIPKELLESELFGHVKGAFTGAVKDKKGKFVEAEGGTIFLDEIGELSGDLQPKILRALQEMEVVPVGSNKVVHVDVRVVSATNRDMEASIEAGIFREDLYYRLAVVPIHMPSLRERSSDIPLLIKHFLKTLAPDEQVKMAPEAMKALTTHQWKGNVRELENTIQRLLILREGKEITLSDLPDKIRHPTNVGSNASFSFIFPDEGVGLEDAEKELILEALRRAEGNQSRAARLLKIPRHVLLYRLEKYGIRTDG